MLLSRLIGTSISYSVLVLPFLKYSKEHKKSHQTDKEIARRCAKYFEGVDFSAADETTWAAFRDARLADGVSEETVKRELAFLRSAVKRFNESSKRKVVFEMPALKKTKERIRYLSEQEAENLMSAALNSRNQLLQVIIKLALSTGMRKSEIRFLAEEQISFEDKTVTLTRYVKNARTIILPLNESAIEAIEEALHYKKQNGIESDYVFAQTSGAPIGDFKKSYRNALEKAGLKDFTFHDLRHDFATKIRRKGAPLDHIQHLLNQSSIEMVERYAHLDVESLRSSVNRLDR